MTEAGVESLGDDLIINCIVLGNVAQCDASGDGVSDDRYIVKEAHQFAGAVCRIAMVGGADMGGEDGGSFV